MLNKDYILKKIRPYLNANRELSEFEFSLLFSQLKRQEQDEVLDIMKANWIKSVEEKLEEQKELVKSPILNESEKVIADSLMALTNEELCVLYQKGNNAALAALIEKNKRFIMKYVIKRIKSFRRQCLTKEDLFQEGVFGVVTAAKRFNADLSYSFLTYCGYWIDQSITRAIENSGFIIRLPVHRFNDIIKVEQFRRKNPLATEDELVEIIKESGWDLSKESLRKYIFYGERCLNTASLNDLVGENADTERIDLCTNDSALPEQLAGEHILREALDDVLDTLTPREKKIITMRFGLDDREPMTLEQIGKVFGVTRERIRQIEAKALRKLRHPSRLRKLRDFLD